MHTSRHPNSTCHLLEGVTAWLAQLSLFTFGCLLVFVAWKIETSPKRSFREFCKDSFILALGSITAHFLNLWVVLRIVHQAPITQTNVSIDECAAYIVFYVLDFGFSTVLYWLFFKASSACVYIRCPLQGTKTRTKLFLWVFSVASGKIIIFLLFWVMRVAVKEWSGQFALIWEHRVGLSEVWWSSFMVPAVLNGLQLVLTSYILKNQRIDFLRSHHAYSSPTEAHRNVVEPTWDEATSLHSADAGAVLETDQSDH